MWIPNWSIVQAAPHAKTHYWLLKTRFWYDIINTLQKQEPYMNLYIDSLGDPLRTCPIRAGWVFTINPYQHSRFGFIDDLHRHFGNGSDCTRTRAQSDGPEPSLTQFALPLRWVGMLYLSRSRFCAVFSTSLGDSSSLRAGLGLAAFLGGLEAFLGGLSLNRLFCSKVSLLPILKKTQKYES